MRVAVVGAGGIGKTHIANLSRMEGVELVAICDKDIDRARLAGSSFGVKNTYSGLDDMLQHHELDAVFICTPPFAHQEAIVLSAESGVNLFVEKPLDSDLNRAKKSVKICSGSGIISQVGYHWRFHSGRREARQLLLEEGGPLGIFEGRWWGGIYRVPWWTKRSLSGGQITEQTTHIFDQARWLMGEVENVYAVTATRINGDLPGYDIEDVAVIALKFRSGAIGVVTSTNASFHGEVGVKIVAQNVKYEDYVNRVLLRWRDYEAEYRSNKSPYLAEEESFIEHVRRGVESEVDVEEGLRSLELSLAALKSSSESRPVELPL